VTIVTEFVRNTLESYAYEGMYIIRTYSTINRAICRLVYTSSTRNYEYIVVTYYPGPIILDLENSEKRTILLYFYLFNNSRDMQ